MYRGIVDDYFQWMCSLVQDGKKSRRLSYKKLLQYLFEREFETLIDNDCNRAMDGINLRRRFSDECAYCMDDSPCSVLEMMVALANRCEEQIMDDPDIGDRTGQWFWTMVKNLGLADMTDERFNEARADTVITRFLRRRYRPDGRGGLFTVKNCPYDLRSVEIWYQMCWYLNQFLGI